MWGNPLTRGRIRDTSNSRKIHFGGGFALLLKLIIIKVIKVSLEELACSKIVHFLQVHDEPNDTLHDKQTNIII